MFFQEDLVGFASLLSKRLHFKHVHPCARCTPFALFGQISETGQAATLTFGAPQITLRIIPDWPHLLIYRSTPFREFAKGGLHKVVLADVPLYQKPEQGYIRMFPSTQNRNKGTFVRRFPMEPFLETLWGPLVPISAY